MNWTKEQKAKKEKNDRIREETTLNFLKLEFHKLGIEIL